VFEVQCPHCDKDIELEDGMYGLFVCPHCNEDFSWERNEYSIGNQFKNAGILFLISASVIFVIVFVIMLFDGPGEAIEWTFFVLAILSPILIPVALIPSCIYLLRNWIKMLKER